MARQGASPELRRLAERLTALETASGGTREVRAGAAVSAVDRLRQPLSNLAGQAGFRALLARALALAGNEVRWLKALHVDPDGTLAGLDEAHLSEAEIAAGGAVLIAQLITLLVTFIGEALTLQILREAWPEAALQGLDGGSEGKA